MRYPNFVADWCQRQAAGDGVGSDHFILARASTTSVLVGFLGEGFQGSEMFAQFLADQIDQRLIDICIAFGLCFSRLGFFKQRCKPGQINITALGLGFDQRLVFCRQLRTILARLTLQPVFQARQQLNRRQGQLLNFIISILTAIQHPVEQVFHGPGPVTDFIGTDHTSGAFQRVETAADFGECLLITGILEPGGKMLLHAGPNHGGFLGEDLQHFGVDIRSRIILCFIFSGICRCLRSLRFSGARLLIVGLN